MGNLLRRVVSYEEGERYAKENGMIFLEASNKEAKNEREVSHFSGK